MLRVQVPPIAPFDFYKNFCYNIFTKQKEIKFMNLFYAKTLLQKAYLDMVSEALAGKELKSAEECAEEFLEKLDFSR